MEYTVDALSRLAGVSKRTLWYYDEIELLTPKRKSSNGYRIYGEYEIDRLQLILFYRNLDMPLDTIKQLLNDVDFDSEKALLEHRQRLLAKKAQIDQLLETIDQTLASKKGEIQFSDREKFVGFKKELLDNNEVYHGSEIREKYGNETIEKANQKFARLSQDDYKKMQDLAAKILVDLKTAIQTNDSASQKALQLAQLHKDWLAYTWPSYSKEAHRELAQMYVDDPRFTNYYDEPAGSGAAEFLRDAILNYLG
ncbi:MerR family transcriptional regulator [Carnobacterium pleistocenium]|uniref:MerR family transcriptional regulator n=1 Tax=Carnobacterium pleistocenium TaxID=181073 RepID=UPI00054DFD42|nr:MerR family transcriptional regulator [Carnobacterium pleistocenium]